MGWTCPCMPSAEVPPRGRYAAPVRGVAQLGSAPALGAGGREFESPLPDHMPSDRPASPMGGIASSFVAARGARYVGRRRGCSSMARAPAFQAGYAGSIPVTRSM